MLWKVGLDGRSAANQYHLMIRQRPADFKAAEEMSDSQNMLAVLDYFHINNRFIVQGSGFKGLFCDAPFGRQSFDPESFNPELTTEEPRVEGRRVEYRTAEYRMTKDGIASRNLFLKQTEYIHSTFDVERSMLDVH
jgi:hypothetical protein